jgi:DNA-binding beta-propeller fold protein YncE
MKVIDVRIRIPLAMVGCLLAAASADAGVLLVGNKSADTLWALDTATGVRTASFDTGVGPHEIEVSPDGRLAVVSNYGDRERPGSSLTVLDWLAGRSRASWTWAKTRARTAWLSCPTAGSS